jgi:hypothetical protein
MKKSQGEKMGMENEDYKHDVSRITQSLWMTIEIKLKVVLMHVDTSKSRAYGKIFKSKCSMAILKKNIHVLSIEIYFVLSITNKRYEIYNSYRHCFGCSFWIHWLKAPSFCRTSESSHIQSFLIFSKTLLYSHSSTYFHIHIFGYMLWVVSLKSQSIQRARLSLQ